MCIVVDKINASLIDWYDYNIEPYIQIGRPRPNPDPDLFEKDRISDISMILSDCGILLASEPEKLSALIDQCPEFRNWIFGDPARIQETRLCKRTLKYKKLRNTFRAELEIREELQDEIYALMQGNLAPQKIMMFVGPILISLAAWGISEKEIIPARKSIRAATDNYYLIMTISHPILVYLRRYLHPRNRLMSDRISMAFFEENNWEFFYLGLASYVRTNSSPGHLRSDVDFQFQTFSRTWAAPGSTPEFLLFDHLPTNFKVLHPQVMMLILYELEVGSQDIYVSSSVITVFSSKHLLA